MRPHPYGALPRRQPRYGRSKLSLTGLAVSLAVAIAGFLAGLGAPHLP